VVLFGTNPRARQARKVSDMCGVIPVVLIGLRDHFETKQLLSLRAKVHYGIALSVLWSRAATSMAPSVAPSVARSKAPWMLNPPGKIDALTPRARGGRPEGRGFGPSTGWDPPPKASSKGGASLWLKRVMETQIPSLVPVQCSRP
jgi:hypothetical protein